MFYSFYGLHSVAAEGSVLTFLEHPFVMPENSVRATSESGRYHEVV